MMLARIQTASQDGRGPSPISRLHQDLLWTIFKNDCTAPDIPSSDNFDMLKNSSEVCRDWRSSLWGKVINVELLDQKTDHWREEILRRTGNSLLWITGGYHIHHPTPGYFVLGILKKYWPRIEKLSVWVDGTLYGENEKWLSFLRSPAPFLKQFDFRIPYFMDDSESFLASSPPLFADSAPNLAWFEAPDLKFNTQSTWLGNLCRATLHPTFSVSEILDVLQAMQRLEYLRIEARRELNNDEIIPDQLPRADVPRLVWLFLDDTFARSAAILKHIYPAPGCALQFYCSSLPFAYDGRLNEPLARLTGNYFRHYVATKIDIQCGRQAEGLFVLKNAGHEYCWDFLVSFSDCLELEEEILSLFVLHPSYFSKVTSLDYVVRDRGPRLISILKTISASSFPSVTVFTTDGSGLEVFLPTCTRIPLPLLHTVKFQASEAGPQDESELCQIILEFMTQYRSIGIPISIFHVNQSFVEGQPPDMDMLEDLVGLKVELETPWIYGGTQHYICGSGQPENLRFKSFWLPQLVEERLMRGRYQAR